MSNIEIKHLLRNNRFTDNDWKFISLVCYIPFGIILFTLRTFGAIVVVFLGWALPDSAFARKLINKVTCLSLGINVVVENPEKKENVDVYVSNSLSIFDHLAVHTATGSVSAGRKLQPVLAKCIGIQHFGNQSNFEEFKKNVSAYISKNEGPIFFTPEGKSTNGKALLKFKSYPFSFTPKVQPICISIDRPLLDISVYSLGSSYWSDVFFFMFSPLTSYKLKFLASLEKKSLSDEDFADIVRQNIATGLQVEAVDLSASDLLEWEKRELAEQQRIRDARSSNESNRTANNLAVRRMAMQVKEVLPHVPLDVIVRDLCRTKNVDNTITNILEGRVMFIPEQPPSPARQESPSPSSSSSSPSTSSKSAIGTSTMFNTSASSFAKCAQDRSKSFHERKAQLIAQARQRYIEKHNLDIPV